MRTATMRVTRQTKQYLTRLARSEGCTTAQALDRIVARQREDDAWRAAGEAYAKPSSHALNVTAHLAAHAGRRALRGQRS